MYFRHFGSRERDNVRTSVARGLENETKVTNRAPLLDVIFIRPIRPRTPLSPLLRALRLFSRVVAPKGTRRSWRRLGVHENRGKLRRADGRRRVA